MGLQHTGLDPRNLGSKTPFNNRLVVCAILKENFGHDRSKSKCFQAQPSYMLTSFDFFWYEFEVYSIYSSKKIGSFVEVLNFNRVFIKLNLFN